MTMELYLSFILVSLLVIAMPGPNILVIVSTSLTAGRVRGLQTVIGTSLAMILQLSIAALGTTGLLTLLNNGLRWLKWAGVAYLLYLAITAFRQMVKPQAVQVSGLGSYQKGFWVSLTNPKTIFFFSAFLPQFVNDGQNYLLQISLLSATFWVLAVVIDSSYALMSAKARVLLSNPRFQKLQNGLTGTLYLSASALLASSNRS